MSPHSCQRRSLFLAALLMAAASSGCTTFSPSGSSFGNLIGKPAPKAPAPVASAVCHVELRKSRARTVDVPISAETRVQDVIVATKADRAFRRPSVSIHRPTNNPREPVLKLVCNYNVKAKKVSLETDYSVLPGDTVVVEENRAGPIDEMMGSLLGLAR